MRDTEKFVYLKDICSTNELYAIYHMLSVISYHSTRDNSFYRNFKNNVFEIDTDNYYDTSVNKKTNYNFIYFHSSLKFRWNHFCVENIELNKNHLCPLCFYEMFINCLNSCGVRSYVVHHIPYEKEYSEKMNDKEFNCFILK